MDIWGGPPPPLAMSQVPECSQSQVCLCLGWWHSYQLAIGMESILITVLSPFPTLQPWAVGNILCYFGGPPVLNPISVLDKGSMCPDCTNLSVARRYIISVCSTYGKGQEAVTGQEAAPKRG